MGSPRRGGRLICSRDWSCEKERERESEREDEEKSAVVREAGRESERERWSFA